MITHIFKIEDNLSHPLFFYITYFLINAIPVAIIAKIDIVSIIYCPVVPVCSDKITGASSWSSSPST